MAVTVEEFIPDVFGKPYLIVKSDKFNHTFKIEPTNDGFVFYRISVDKGNLPNTLTGNYSTMKAALQALTEYERLAKKSATKRRDENAEEREKRKLQAFEE